MDQNRYLSPGLINVMSMLDRYSRLSPKSELVEKIIALQSGGMKSSIAVTAASLRQSRISGLFSKASFSSKMLDMAEKIYWRKVERLLEDLAGETEVEGFEEVDFFSEEDNGGLIIVREIPKVQRLMGEIYQENHKLYKIAPNDFEELMAEYLRKEGWEVRLTKKTRDGGYDMVALQEIGSLPFKMIAECKRYAQNRKVGVNILREFQSVIYREKANKGILFTSSYFSLDVKREKNILLPHLLDLRDYDDIMKWIRSEQNDLIV